MLIPAIDLRQGQVVRLSQGDDARRQAYDRDPHRLLQQFAEAGARRAHIIDLDAAFGEAPQHRLIRELVTGATLDIELGGGLRDHDTVAAALDLGCERVILGSMVARDPDGFEALCGQFPNRLVPALEVAAGQLKIAGWTESASIGVDELGRRLNGLPCPAVLVTDVERDGTLEGPNLELACHLGRLTGFPALLSGGVHRLDDLRQAAAAPEVGGIIVGKALYEGRFSLDEAVAAAKPSAVKPAAATGVRS